MYCVPSRSITGPELMAFELRRRRKPPAPPEPSEPTKPSKFTASMLTKMAKDVQSGALPVPKKNPWINIGDDRVPGLRAIIRKSGAVTFHAMYSIADSRPMMTIGQFPGTSIEEARHLANIVRSLARSGTDPQEGLYSRLLKELARDGTGWRPYGYVDKVMQALRDKGVKIPDAVAAEVRKELT